MTQGPPEERLSDKDQVRPFHARDVATGQETADVVAAVLKHAAERDEAAKRKTAPKAQPIWMLPLAVMLGVLAGFLLVAPPEWVVVNPVAAQSPEEQTRDTHAGIVFYGQKIEGYRIANGHLPATLAEANISVANLDYTVRGESYILITSVDGQNIVFDSARESLQEWGSRMASDLSRRIGG